MIQKICKKFSKNYQRKFCQQIQDFDKEKQKQIEELRGKFAAERMFENLNEKQIINNKNLENMSQTQLKKQILERQQLEQVVEQSQQKYESEINMIYNIIQRVKSPMQLLKFYQQKKFYLSQYHYVHILQRLEILLKRLDKSQKMNERFIQSIIKAENTIFQDLIYTIKQNYKEFNIGLQIQLLDKLQQILLICQFKEIMNDQLSFLSANKIYTKLNNKKLLQYMAILQKVDHCKKKHFKECDDIMDKFMNNFIIKKEKEKTTPELIQELQQQKYCQKKELFEKLQQENQLEDELISQGILQMNERQIDELEDYQEFQDQQQDENQEENENYLEIFLMKKEMHQQYKNQQEHSDNNELSIFTTQQLVRLLVLYIDSGVKSRVPQKAFRAILDSDYFQDLQILHINVLLGYAKRKNRRQLINLFEMLINNHFKDENYLKFFENNHSKMQSQYIKHMCYIKTYDKENFFEPSPKDDKKTLDLIKQITKLNNNIFEDFLRKNHMKSFEIPNILMYLRMFQPDIEKSLIKNILKNTFRFSEYFSPLDLSKCLYQSALLYQDRKIQQKYDLEYNRLFQFLTKSLEMHLKNLDRQCKQYIQKVIKMEIRDLQDLKRMIDLTSKLYKQLKKQFKIICNGGEPTLR